jgi:bifunctional non-homologous end joining protein LigD
MVEDHPLDYGDFEGNIPKGNYGAGSVMLWDRGTFQLEGDGDGMQQIARGDLKFTLHGEKLQGSFVLVHMKNRGKGPGGAAKGNEWLIIKHRDDYVQPGWDIENFAYSVKTGRTQEEIAADLPAHEKKTAPASKKKSPAVKKKLQA